MTKDSAALNKIFSREFVLISPDGSKITRAEIINRLGTQETVFVNIYSIGIKLLTADVGLITTYTTFILKIDGKDVTGQNCYQDLYVKRENTWQAVAAHVTLLNTK